MAKTKIAKLRKPHKLMVIVAGALLLIGAGIAGVYFYNTHQYTTVFSEVNSDTVESLIASSKESSEYEKLMELLKVNAETGAIDNTNLKEAGRLSSQIADRLNTYCENYDTEFVMSKDVPVSFFSTLLLSSEQKENLTQLAKSLSIQEERYCTDARANAGIVVLTYDATVAYNNWYLTYSSTYTDTEAISALKKFNDGSYKTKYREDMIRKYGNGIDQQIDTFTTVYSAAYDYSVETDESLYGGKWSTLIAAQNKYKENPILSGLEDIQREQSKKSLEEIFAFYQVVSNASQKEAEKFHYSSSASVGALLANAINMHSADLDTKPVASSTVELVKILKAKNYIDSNLDLPLTGIEYASTDGSTATLTITIEATGKSYEVSL